MFEGKSARIFQGIFPISIHKKRLFVVTMSKWGRVIDVMTRMMQVRSVSVNGYTSAPVRKREDCLQLYGPIALKEESIYDIVAHNNNRNLSTCLSLFRTPAAQEAESVFDLYQKSIPKFLGRTS